MPLNRNIIDLEKNYDREHIPVKPLGNIKRYIPNMIESKLWSKEIKIEIPIIPRMVYRVREDYINVLEIYDQEGIKPPELRHIGTDVIIHSVSSDGKFGYIYDLGSKKLYKIFYKFLRVLNVGERYFPNPNIISFGSIMLAYSMDITKKNILSEDNIFDLKLVENKFYLKYKIRIPNMIIRANHTVRAYTVYEEDVAKILLEGLCIKLELYGVLNKFEKELYEYIATDRIYEHPIVQNALNNFKNLREFLREK